MQDIKERARKVNSVAEEYSLSHAVMALRRIIEEENRASYPSELRDLKKRIFEETEQEITEYEKLRKRLFNLEHKRVFIVVDYLTTLSYFGARTIMSEGDYIEILLPDKLKKDVDALRRKLGHELGHLALHLDDFYQASEERPFQGTLEIRDKNKEDEADVFSKELVLLREEHLKAVLCNNCKKNDL